MQTIHKYRLMIADKQTLALPKGAIILTMMNQSEAPTMWARVDTDQPAEDHVVRMFGTGHPANISTMARYLGTSLGHGGRTALHVFIEKAEDEDL